MKLRGTITTDDLNPGRLLEGEPQFRRATKTVELEIDEEALVQEAGRRALWKDGKATFMNGSIRCRLLPTESGSESTTSCPLGDL